MSTSKLISSSGAPDESRSSIGKLERDAEVAGAAVAGGLTALDVAAVVFLGLFVVPPLAILVFLVVVPVLVLGLIVGLLVAIVSTPYLLFHRLRGHHGHWTLLVQRIRHAGRALFELLPHRIVAGVRSHHAAG